MTHLSQTNVEIGFQDLNESVKLLQKTLDTSFFDAYVENGENLLDGGSVRVIDNVPSQSEVTQLETYYQELLNMDLSVEEKRKITQLTLLSGLKVEPLQANHQLTPDSIGFLFVYMIEQLTKHEKNNMVVGDLSVGMGNLLYTILSNLDLAGYKDIRGVGVDADDLLLQVAAVNKNWLGLEVELFHQDSLEPLLIEPLDVAIADLPIGYYPKDEVAKDFMTSFPTEHSYAHHLIMEQSMRYVKEGGFGLFLLPNNFLETEQADILKKWLVEEVYLQGILQLPKTLFSQKGLGKSIVLVQNKGGESLQSKEVLLAELPSLKENQSVLNFVNQFRQWCESNIK